MVGEPSTRKESLHCDNAQLNLLWWVSDPTQTPQQTVDRPFKGTLSASKYEYNVGGVHDTGKLAGEGLSCLKRILKL